LYRENRETQKAIEAYRQAFSRLEAAWKKLPSVDIDTEIPIPQYLPQQQPILSTNAIEKLHREFIALLKETDQGNSQIKESLKRHFIAELNFSMESGNWKDADRNTLRLISSDGGIENISCKDLSSIDRLWVERSDGMFGFSVQNIFLDKFAFLPSRDFVREIEMERRREYQYQPLDEFYEKIGWKEDGRWLNYVFNPKKAKKGHLPSWFWGVDAPSFLRRQEIFPRDLSRRLVDCNIQAFQSSLKMP